MKPQNSQLWLYGIHACRMALENPRRQIISILVLHEDSVGKILPISESKNRHQSKVKVVDRQRLEGVLVPGAVHQGVAVHVAPLARMTLEDLDQESGSNQCVVVLDQVSDPHNVGAILRSAAVFGAKAVILTDRHAPPESGTLAKSASGALEIVPLIRVVNLGQALKELKDMGFWCVGLAESGSERFDQVNLKGKIALVMGAEGEGMRRLTKDLCDFTVCLPSATPFSTLNVSNAAAIVLYETFRAHQSGLKR